MSSMPYARPQVKKRKEVMRVPDQTCQVGTVLTLTMGLPWCLSRRLIGSKKEVNADMRLLVKMEIVLTKWEMGVKEVWGWWVLVVVEVLNSLY